MKRKLKGLVVAIVGSGLLAASAASAAITLPTTVDMAPVETWAGTLMGAGVVMLCIRKLTKTTNRT